MRATQLLLPILVAVLAGEALGADWCAPWCNYYTCAGFPMCSTCSVCAGGGGKHPPAPSPPVVNLVRQQGPNGTSYCAERAEPVMTSTVSAYGTDFTYTEPLWFDGTDPVKLYEQCLKAVGDNGATTISFDPAWGGAWCNRDCEYMALDSDGDEFYIYSEAGHQMGTGAEMKMPLTCNAKPYQVRYCNAAENKFYTTFFCDKRLDSGPGTIFSDCLGVFSEEPAVPNGCYKEVVTEDDLMQLSEGNTSYTGWTRDIKGNWKGLTVGQEVMIHNSCTEGMGLLWEIWTNLASSCTPGTADVTYVTDGIWGIDAEEQAACAELGLLTSAPGGDGDTHYLKMKLRRRGLVSTTLQHARELKAMLKWPIWKKK